MRDTEGLTETWESMTDRDRGDCPRKTYHGSGHPPRGEVGRLVSFGSLSGTWSTDGSSESRMGVKRSLPSDCIGAKTR
jgi:hypothetical protein